VKRCIEAKVRTGWVEVEEGGAGGREAAKGEKAREGGREEIEGVREESADRQGRAGREEGESHALIM